MSLISDPDYLIHNLRLTYLRHVEDPYGPRIISFNSRYTSNAHVLVAGLADVGRWPELVDTPSPQPSDDEGAETDRANGRRNPSGFTGATGLKYTQTIMGPSRIGALGMRVSGRRALTDNNSAVPPLPADAHTKRLRADSEPTHLPSTSSTPSAEHHSDLSEKEDISLIQVGKRRSAGGSSLSELAATLVDVDRTPEIEHPRPPAAVHSLTHIANLQARRQRRRAHFHSAGSGAARPIIVSETTRNPEASSSEENDDAILGSVPDDDEFEHVGDAEDGIDGDADDFDPDFAPPRIGPTSSASDVNYAVSSTNSILSTSNSSTYNSSLHVSRNPRGRSRLSPVDEAHTRPHPPTREDTEDDHSGAPAQPRVNGETSMGSYFEIVQPGKGNEQFEKRRNARRGHARRESPPPSEELLFTRVSVRPRSPSKPVQSALTAKLASSNTSSNPFTELYALISGRAEIASTNVTVFFPHARSPIGQSLVLQVRKDATVEEVLGFALWSYWEADWEPKLDDGLDGADEAKRNARLSAAGWVLRIAEDDGEVDEDFPAPDRLGRISNFQSPYAILEGTTSQVAQNQQLEAKIVRRPSRIIVAKKKPEPTVTAAPSLGPSTSAALSSSSMGTSVALSSSLSGQGPQILLRIRVADVTDTAVHYSSTIPVAATMYMQDVLELICRKRKIKTPNDWALLSDDFKILIPLDRTVASLEGSSRLVLVLRSTLPQYGFAVDGDRRVGRTTDPNASIFNQASEAPRKNKVTEMDFIAAYKRYTVFRKVPMLVARLERTLTIDGDYIYIMPSANKARGVFDNGRTISYHIKRVVSCMQSGKGSSSFKIVFLREGGDKRYDFEAESAKLANEIVTAIRSLKAGLERSSTVNKSRRSRQVGLGTAL